MDLTDGFRDSAGALIRSAAEALLAAGPAAAARGSDFIKAKLEEAAADKSSRITLLVEAAARRAWSALSNAAEALDIENRPDEKELLDVLKDMPRFDLGAAAPDVDPGRVASLLGRRMAVRSVEGRIWKTAGQEVADAISNYGRVLQAWVRRVFTELQARFDSYADVFRAQLARLTSDNAPVAGEDQALLDDLAALARGETGEPAGTAVPGVVA